MRKEFNEPKDFREMYALLKALGFNPTKYGKGSHIKFELDGIEIPDNERCKNQPPFIIIPQKCKRGLILAVIKDLKDCFGFTEDQIKEVS